MLRPRHTKQSSDSTTANGGNSTDEFSVKIEKLRQQQKSRRENVTLFRAPIRTLSLCFQELLSICFRALRYVAAHRFSFSVLVLLLIFDFLMSYFVNGPHRQILDTIHEELWVYGEWVVLGVLSSIGLGTGLHTFVLYLGPHIAKVTLAATECNSLDFQLRGPDAFLCPAQASTGVVTFWAIVRKVNLACFWWGFGTALGELPPYFVARAARRSGERLEELEGFAEESRFSSFMKTFQTYFDKVMGKFTFIAILLLASVPNPLFDLAGLTCGYSLIPFWTFFGATVLGKAFIKAHLQCFVVVVLFMKETLAWVVSTVEGALPFLAGRVSAYFEKERERFHPEFVGKLGTSSRSPLAQIWNVILITMVLAFFVSIINSTAQSCLVEMDEREIQEYTKKNKPHTTTTESSSNSSQQSLHQE